MSKPPPPLSVTLRALLLISSSTDYHLCELNSHHPLQKALRVSLVCVLAIVAGIFLRTQLPTLASLGLDRLSRPYQLLALSQVAEHVLVFACSAFSCFVCAD